jgi:3D (Asp-Asp-Asp) domain-containing protein
VRLRLVPLLILAIVIPAFVGACFVAGPADKEDIDWRRVEVVPKPVYELPPLEKKESPAPIILNKKIDGITLVSVDPMPAKIESVGVVPPKEEKEYYIVRMVVRAYCPCVRCCGSRAQGVTSTQTNAWKPGIAVARTVIPYGTKMVVSGYNDDESAYADDTGPNTGLDKEGRPKIEVRTVYHWQAREWGRQVIDVKVYKTKN